MDIIAIICLIVIVCELYELNKRNTKLPEDLKDQLAQLYLIQCELKGIKKALIEKEEQNENKVASPNSDTTVAESE